MLRVTGMSWSRITDLKTSLSMHSAEASTPAPTYGHARELEQSLHGPVLAERAVQHREDDVDIRERRRHVARRQSLERGRPARLEPPRRAAADRPASAAVDLDRDHLVPARAERGRDTRRGGDRDRVLARAAAEDDGDAAAHGTVVVVCVVVTPLVVVGVVGGTTFWSPPWPPPAPLGCSWPTVITTTSPCCPVEPPTGSWLTTIPSWLGSVTGSMTRPTVKPAAFRIRDASACVWFVTSGICDVAGPLDTESVIFEPLATLGPLRRVHRYDHALGLLVGLHVDPRDREALAAQNGLRLAGRATPVTSGSVTGFGPRETLIVTVLPFFTWSPAAGFCPVTVSSCCPE